LRAELVLVSTGRIERTRQGRAVNLGSNRKETTIVASVAISLRLLLQNCRILQLALRILLAGFVDLGCHITILKWF
jgi:hypothetical protein